MTSFATFYLAHFCGPKHSDLSPIQNYKHNDLLYVYPALSVFTIWVVCSPVWNSKDTLKLPLLGRGVCECVCWWEAARGACVLASVCWRPLLNGLWHDRTLVLSATHSCPAARLPAAVSWCWLWRSCCLWHAKSFPFEFSSAVRPSVSLSLSVCHSCASCLSMPPRCGESESIFFFKFFLVCLFVVFYRGELRLRVLLSLSLAKLSPTLRELGTFSGWVNCWNNMHDIRQPHRDTLVEAHR